MLILAAAILVMGVEPTPPAEAPKEDVKQEASAESARDASAEPEPSGEPEAPAEAPADDKAEAGTSAPESDAETKSSDAGTAEPAGAGTAPGENESAPTEAEAEVAVDAAEAGSASSTQEDVASESPGEAPPDRAATEAALEADMEAAKEEIDEKTGGDADAEKLAVEKPAEETSKPEEEAIVAQPATESAGTPTNEAAAAAAASQADGEEGAGPGQGVGMAVNGAGVRDSGRPYMFFVGLSHALGSGTFASYNHDDVPEGFDPDYGRPYDMAVQTWDLRAQYTKQLFGHQIRFRGRQLIDVELTTPSNVTGNRFTPYDFMADVTDMTLFSDPEYTGINLYGGVRARFPTSYASIHNTKRRLQLGGFVGATRSFGPVTLIYQIGMAKNFNGSPYTQGKTDVPPRSGEGESAQELLTRVSANPFQARGQGSFQVPTGVNVAFDLTNSISVMYQPFKDLTLSYSLLFWTQWNYNVAPEEDDLTPQNADVGRQRSMDFLWPTLSATYSLHSALESVTELPFQLLAGVSISALHPAQSDDNGKILLPFFYDSFGSRAGNNEGLVSFDLTAIY